MTPDPAKPLPPILVNIFPTIIMPIPTIALKPNDFISEPKPRKSPKFEKKVIKTDPKERKPNTMSPIPT